MSSRVDVSGAAALLTSRPARALGWAAIAFVVGVLGIGRPSYWFDESATLSAVDRSPGQLLHLLRHVDAVHGLYYYLLLGWTRVFGDGETATRLPSLLALCAATAGFFVLVSSWRGDRVATIATALFVVLPGIAWTGGEARDYSFALAASVWAFVQLHHAVAGGGSRHWVAYGALLVVGYAFSIMTVLVLVVHVAYYLSARPRPPARAAVVTWVVSLAVAAPLFAWAVTERSQLDFIHVTVGGLARRVLLGQFFQGPRDGTSAAVAIGAVTLLIASVGLAGVALVRTTGAARRSVLLAVGWAVVPTVLLALPVLANVQFYQERYLVFAAPGVCLAVAEGVLAVLTRPVLVAAATLAMVLLAAMPLAAQRDPLSKWGDDYRGLAAFARGAQVVLYTVPNARGIGIAYPVHARDALLRRAPAASGTLWGRNRHFCRQVRCTAPTVVLYRSADHSAVARRAAAALHGEGCRETGRLAATRITAIRYRCPR